MSVATITSKGQITLPRDIRDKLHLETGGKIDFRIDEETGTAVLVPMNRTAKDLFGILGAHGRKKGPVSVEDLDAAIRRQFRKKSG